jgi:hypothetical protein
MYALPANPVARRNKARGRAFSHQLKSQGNNMAKDSGSGVPGTTTNGDNAATPYTPPAQNDCDTSFIKGFGSDSPKSIQKKIFGIPEQTKKAVE